MSGRELWVLASGAEERSEWAAGLARLGEALSPLRARIVEPTSAGPSAPEMILLPHQGWRLFLSSLRSCKQRWAGAPVLGLVPLDEMQPEPLGEAFRQGMEDFVSAPVRMPELIARLSWMRGSRQAKHGESPSDFEDWKRQHELQNLVGASPAFERVLRKIPTLGATDATVLILGETGTGKELFARALHYSSRRKAAGFVPVNCGAVPEHLFENELFGHARGAYTDARSDAAGLLEIAEGGTLFLDEVDSLSPAAQVKLLRLLQSREYRPLGSAETRRADIRIVAAANSDLARLVKQGRLREDLYYRLNVLRIQVPALRERPGDILLLAQHFLECLSRDYDKRGFRLGSAASAQLCAHPWPGNVREMEAVIERAVLMSDGPVLQASDLELGGENDAPLPVEWDAASMRDAKAVLIEQFERNYLVELLKRCGGNVSQAARAAGKERRAFQRLLRKRGVKHD